MPDADLFPIDAVIEAGYATAMIEHRDAVISARRSVGQVFRWAFFDTRKAAPERGTWAVDFFGKGISDGTRI